MVRRCGLLVWEQLRARTLLILRSKWFIIGQEMCALHMHELLETVVECAFMF